MFGFWKPNSPEYNRLKELAGELKLAIEPDIRPLSDDLLSKEIIAKDTNWLMYSRYSSSSAKAAYLVKAVLKKVQKSPEDYHQVVKILKQRNQYGKKGHYKDIIRELGKPLPQPVPQQPWRAEDQDLLAVVRDAWKSMWMWCSLPVMVYSFILTIVIIIMHSILSTISVILCPSITKNLCTIVVKLLWLSLLPYYILCITS